MTQQTALSIACKEIATDWYLLACDVQIFHEDASGRSIAKVLTIMQPLAAFDRVYTTVEKVRRHSLNVKRQMLSLQKKVKSLARPTDVVESELEVAQAALFDDSHTIPMTLAGKDIDMTLSLFAFSLANSRAKIPALDLADSYERLCFRAYNIHHKASLNDRLKHQAAKREQSTATSSDEAPQQEPSTGKEVTAHLASCAVGVALAPTTFGLSLIAPLYTQFRLNRIHSKKYQ